MMKPWHTIALAVGVFLTTTAGIRLAREQKRPPSFPCHKTWHRVKVTCLEQFGSSASAKCEETANEAYNSCLVEHE